MELQDKLDKINADLCYPQHPSHGWLALVPPLGTQLLPPYLTLLWTCISNGQLLPSNNLKLVFPLALITIYILYARAQVIFEKSFICLKFLIFSPLPLWLKKKILNTCKAWHNLSLSSLPNLISRFCSHSLIIPPKYWMPTIFFWCTGYLQFSRGHLHIPFFSSR